MAGPLGFFKALLGKCETRPLDVSLWKLEDGAVRVKLDQVPELSAKGGAVYLAGPGLEAPVLIVRAQDDRLLAFRNKCTHGGRKIDPAPKAPALRCCSLGHSTFDYDGKRLSGPAKDHLKRYDAEFRDGDLVIRL